MKRRQPILCIILFCCLQLWGQERKPWVVRTVNKLGAFIDTLTIKGIDSRYIEVPEKPWQLVLKFNANDMDLKSKSHMSSEYISRKGYYGEINMESSFKPTMTASIGAWIGYRGYGWGYSLSLTKNNGRNFSIGATGSNYSINLRSRKFSTRELDTSIWGYDEDGYTEIPEGTIETWDDVEVRRTIIDGFYLLNGKRFSHAAAYDQSVKQIRSAGSLVIGAMWFQTSLDYAARKNALLIQVLGDIGRIKIQEGSIGIGYAYNWVPMKNLLVNITAMPMLALLNRTKIDLYDSNYDIFLEDAEVSPTGKKRVPDDQSWQEDITLEKTGSQVKYGKVSFNINARASVTYNFDRYFLNVYGQLNNYRNSIDESTLRLTDWYVNASLGMRF